jgi:hypothetical protein
MFPSPTELIRERETSAMHMYSMPDTLVIKHVTWAHGDNDEQIVVFGFSTNEYICRHSSLRESYHPYIRS